jgi:hypothetical protein
MTVKFTAVIQDVVFEITTLYRVMLILNARAGALVPVWAESAQVQSGLAN